MKKNQMPDIEVKMIQDANLKNYIVRFHRYENEGSFKSCLNGRRFIIQKYNDFVNSIITKKKFLQHVANELVGYVKIEIIHIDRDNKNKKNLIVEMSV